MKPPTLKHTAGIIGGKLRRHGDLTATKPAALVYVFTGASWKPRRVGSVHVWPRANATLATVADLTRDLARRLSFPVAGGFNRLAFTADASGRLRRTHPHGRKPLPLP